jgi:hypothetical protein
MVVVLPAPLPPSRPTMAPDSTRKLTSSSAVTGPYALRKPSTSMEYRGCGDGTAFCIGNCCFG